MEKSTKEKILIEALNLFSEKGYEGTSLQDIADKLKITKTALYRHYISKEDLWNSLIETLESYYAKRFNVNSDNLNIPLTLKELKEFSLRQITFTMNDETIIKTRKLLTIEQFRDEKTAKLASAHFLYGITGMYEHIFTVMISNGLFKLNDPKLLAYEYSTPITAMIHLVDRDPSKKQEAIEFIDRHIDYFIFNNKK